MSTIIMFEVEDRYLCENCKTVLHKPFQSTCGLRMCRECLYTNSETDVVKPDLLCTVCEVTMSSVNHSFFHDRSIEREMRGKVTWCPNEGCNSEVSLDVLKHHKKQECEWRLETCEYGCAIRLTKATRHQHDRSAMEYHLTLLRDKLIARDTELTRMSQLNVELMATKTTQLAAVLDSQSSAQQARDNELKSPTIAMQAAAPTNEMYTAAGDYLWVLPRFKDCARDALETLTSDGLSPVRTSGSRFFTGWPGYLLSLRLYPAGDGQGRGTHLSLYLALHAGKHDHQMAWPFNCKVTVTVPSLPGVCVVLKPDLNPSCYDRPAVDRTQANVGFGLPRLVSITDLMKMQDEDLRIRVIVS